MTMQKLPEIFDKGSVHKFMNWDPNSYFMYIGRGANNTHTFVKITSFYKQTRPSDDYSVLTIESGSFIYDNKHLVFTEKDAMKSIRRSLTDGEYKTFDEGLIAILKNNAEKQKRSLANKLGVSA